MSAVSRPTHRAGDANPALIFGVLPLVIAQGVGAEMLRALGRAVFSGMLPVFYYVIQWFLTRAPVSR
jgi:hypothetical protein